MKRLLVSTAMAALGFGMHQVPDWTGCLVARAQGPPLSDPIQWALVLGVRRYLAQESATFSSGRGSAL
jgi:hypothetical protein